MVPAMSKQALQHNLPSQGVGGYRRKQSISNPTPEGGTAGSRTRAHITFTRPHRPGHGPRGTADLPTALHTASRHPDEPRCWQVAGHSALMPAHAHGTQHT
eukprot:scaffold127395_cov19-Tisochrysis_lutea.AAC.1